MCSAEALDWQDAYAVGDAEIDDQHRELFSLANELLRAREDAGSVYLKLHERVRFHFSHEERLMRRSGYPGRSHHESEHDRLAGLLTAVRSEIAGGDWGIDASIAFFRQWLADHIVQHDSALVRHLRQSAQGEGD